MTADIDRLTPQRLILPGSSAPYAISLSAISYFANKLQILGVCLGHQAIGQVFGNKVICARQVMHGKYYAIQHDGQVVFT